MQVLVVHAHPDPKSFGAALRDAAIRGLESAGHDVHLIDLYEIDYEPWLTEAEHRDYLTLGECNPDPVVRSHIELVKRCDAFVFVFPTFWSGMPAILKGWLDRTMVPDVAFTLDPASQRIHGALRHVRSFTGITTYGSSRRYRWLAGDGGRRTLRALRLSAGVRSRTRWISLDDMDRRHSTDRVAFVAEVEKRMAT